MIAKGVFLASLLTLLLASCYWDSVEALHPAYSNPCDSSQHAVYSLAIKSIISNGCISCHNAGYAGGNVRLDSYESVKFYCENGQVMKAVLRQSGTLPMPPNLALPVCETDKLSAWITANYPQ